MNVTKSQYQTAKTEMRAITDRMANILNNAKMAGRKFTADEETRYENLDKECDRHEAVIRAFENHTPNCPFKPDPDPSSSRYSDFRDFDFVTHGLQNALANNGMFTGYAKEVSDELQNRTGISAKGGLMPLSGFDLKGYRGRGPRNAMTAGTDSEGGYLVETTVLSTIDYLRERNVLIQAGATSLNDLKGDLSIPKKTTKTAAEWLAEGAAGNVKDITFGQVPLSPNRLQVFFEPTKQLVGQSSEDVKNLLKMDAMNAINGAVEAAAINGSGSGAEPLGILGTSGIGDVAGGTNGATPTHDDIVDLESAPALSNADVGKLGYITNTKVRGYLKKLIEDAGSGRYTWPAASNELNGYQAHVTNHVPSDLDKGTATGVCSAILFGNWADLMIGYWSFADVIVDPYSLATSGKLRITITIYADIAVRHAESFAAMKDALTA